MKRWLSTLCLLTTAAAGLSAPDAKPEITAQATNLVVRKPLPPKKTATPTFIDNGGTTLEVTLSAPGLFVLGIEPKECKLGGFTDDKGTKLYTPSRFGSWLNSTPLVAADGERCTIQVGGTTPPAKGAAKIQLKATVVLTCGTDEKSTAKKEIAIKKDQTATVGAYTVKVTGDGGKFGTPQLLITSEKNDLKTAEFFDAKGNAVPLGYPPFRTTDFPAPGKMRYNLYCNLSKKIDAVTVKITYFTKTKSVPAPIDLNFGVGLD